MIAALTFEIVYRLVALPPDYQRPRREASAPVVSVETARAPAMAEPGLRVSARLDQPPRWTAAVFSPRPAAPPAAPDTVLKTALPDPAPPVPESLPYHEPEGDPVLATLPVLPRQAAPVAPIGAVPLVAIIIDDMGYRPGSLTQLAAMPGPLTLAFLPDAESTPVMLERARRGDFEIMLHLPMEPLGDANPGREALMVDLDEAEIRHRVQRALARVPGAVGVNNHMGSRFTVDPRGLDIVMDELRRHRVYFIDSRTNTSSIAERRARAFGIPASSRDVFIDHDAAPEAIARQLGLIERTARRTGSVIAIGHPYPTTLAALETWLPALVERGFRLARIGEVIAYRGCADPARSLEECGASLHLVGADAPATPLEPAEVTP